MYRVIAVGAVLSWGCTDVSPSDEAVALGCDIHTAFAGDEQCLPSIASGTQLHFGPNDYDDPGSYVVPPGSDNLYCVDVPLPENLRYVTGYTASFRPGNHHFSIHARRTGTPDPVLKPCGNLGGATLLPISPDGKHHPIAAGPEYQGAGIEVPGWTTSLPLDIHWINTTDEPLLVEGWLNLDTDEPDVLMGIMELSGGLQMSVPPKSTSIVKVPAGACQIPTNARFATLSGHQHSHGSRVSVYLDSDLIYESFDWEHPFGARYNSADENSAPNRTTKTPGAFSGVLAPGSRKISWECEITNTLDSTIRYGIDVHKNEMCVLGGWVIPPAPNGLPLSCVEQ